jgi:hypothetical protein
MDMHHVTVEPNSPSRDMFFFSRRSTHPIFP